jgi:hypothetical protein
VKHHAAVGERCQPRLASWLRAGWLVSLVALLAACAVLPARACPAIGYSSTVIVRLADDWPPGEDRTVTVDCEGSCVDFYPEGGDDQLSASLTGRNVAFLWHGGSDHVVVTVHDSEGPVTQVDADLDWRRIGGTAECGGPMEATVTIPTP